MHSQYYSNILNMYSNILNIQYEYVILIYIIYRVCACVLLRMKLSRPIERARV